MRNYQGSGEGPSQKNIFMIAGVGIFCAICAAVGVLMLIKGAEWFGIGEGPSGTNEVADESTDDSGSKQPVQPGEVIEIGIAYGTEKKRWLLDAVAEWEKEPAGKQVKINLLPMGSLEGAQEVLAENKNIHVWSPASSVYKDRFVLDWQLKFSGDPIYAEDTLAISPMVFVMWEERYQAFIQKYGELNFSTIEQALNEPAGWDGIAGKPDWGLFKFGHTHPNKSNSGLVSLILMAYDYHKKTRDLQLKDILDTDFQSWFESLEKGVNFSVDSTGTLMERMVLTGPSTYDCVMVYENVAMDNIATAAGRWGEIRIVYPDRNLLNDNPYYILNTPWSDDAHKKTAKVFMEFLMSERIQRRALDHGFRPGNVRVPVKFAGSQFVSLENYGVKVDLNTACEPPKGAVLSNILDNWQRRHGR
ncbi:MAG: substrate-binding domain-containing protein [Planctomycetes bacterium]|nr:substrate-binding domain-containing protein [Planctomycetota bacterium]